MSATISPFAACLPLLATLAVAAQTQDPDLAARRTRLHDAGLQAPLTLYPIAVLGEPNRQVAEALGLVLERHGMPDLEVAEPFVVPKDTQWDQVPALFAAHLAKLAPAAGGPRHHLYAEFLGTPRTGPQEVRFVLLDATGAVVHDDRQTKADADFQRTAAKDPDPLGCATLVAERLFRLANWRKAPGTVQDGKLSQRWRERSGVPPAKELAAMQQRREALAKDLAKAHLVVLPTLHAGAHDAASAARLATAFAAQLGCSAAAPIDAEKLRVAPNSNEQKRLWDLAHAVRKSVAGQRIDGDHVVAVDVGLDRERGAGFVHVVVCTAAGDPVAVEFVNDQHPLWAKLAPQSLADLEAVAVARLVAVLGR